MVHMGRGFSTAGVNTRMSPDDEISRLEERIEVLLAQRGDMEAFGRLVTRYERRLVYYILRFVDDGDHVLTFLGSVALGLSSLTEIGRPRGLSSLGLQDHPRQDRGIPQARAPHRDIG